MICFNTYKSKYLHFLWGGNFIYKITVRVKLYLHSNSVKSISVSCNFKVFNPEILKRLELWNYFTALYNLIMASLREWLPILKGV